jgi:hypothetical protein
VNDTALRQTPTHGAEEFQGAVLGIHTPLFAWGALAMLAALALFSGLFYGGVQDFLPAASWAALPLLLVVAYLRFGYQGKPRGHVRDVCDSLLTGGHARPPQQFPPHPLHEL